MKKDMHLQQETFQIYGTAPAPSRDYHGLSITHELVTLNSWHIAHGPYVFPKVKRCSIEDYPFDKLLQTDIINVFGDHLHFYIMDLATGQYTLTTIPTKLMLKILRMLSYHDILRLSETSKIFWELCNTNTVWKLIFNKRRNFPMNREDFCRGETVGWKSVLRSKLQNRVIESFKQSIKGTFKRPFAITTEYTKPTQNYNFKTPVKKSINRPTTPIIKTITNQNLKTRMNNEECGTKTPLNKTKSLDNIKPKRILRTENYSKTINQRKSIMDKSNMDIKNQLKIPKVLNFSKSTSKLIDLDKLYSNTLASKSTMLLKKTATKQSLNNSQKSKQTISKFTK